MLQEVADDSSHALTGNAFLGCIIAMASLTVLMAVTKSIVVSVNLLCHFNITE